MKVMLAVIPVLTLLTAVLGLPAPTKKDEVEVIPLEKNSPFGDQPIIDTDATGWGSPFPNPFDGLFENIESIMTRMQQHMETLLKSFPLNRGNATADIPDFPVEGHLPVFPPLGDIDLSKGNTTSVTKVIDGHKVVINDTEYAKKDELGGAFFRVRIIDVKPDGESTQRPDVEETTTSTAAPVTKDREPIENSLENEISKSREVPVMDNIETFDEVDFVPLQNTQNNYPQWNAVSPVDVVEDNSVNFEENQPNFEQMQPVDLSRDIYVNQILAESGAPVNPDAEVIFVPQNGQNIRPFNPK